MTPDADASADSALVLLRVPCFNAVQGCKSIVEYEGEPGSRPLKKVCVHCQEHGAPSERVGVHGPQVRKSNPKIPKHFMAYGAEVLYEITCRPMAPFFAHGRVSRHVEGG